MIVFEPLGWKNMWLKEKNLTKDDQSGFSKRLVIDKIDKESVSITWFKKK